MILIAFTALGWTLFLVAIAFFLGSAFVIRGFHERCEDANLCPVCLKDKDYASRILSKMVDGDNDEHTT